MGAQVQGSLAGNLPTTNGNSYLPLLNTVDANYRKAGTPVKTAARMLIQSAGHRYVCARFDIAEHTPFGYVHELFPDTTHFRPEALWLANQLTPQRVRDIVDVLIEPVLDWYQQEYIKTYGYGHLGNGGGLFKTMWAAVPAATKELYRRDADLHICVQVLSDLFRILTLKDDLRWLDFKDEWGNWETLVGHMNGIMSVLITHVLPMMRVGHDD